MLLILSPMWMGMINGWFSLDGYRHSHNLILSLGTTRNLLNHSNLLSTLNDTIICCFCVYSYSSLNNHCSLYVTHLGSACYGLIPSLTCNMNVPSLCLLMVTNLVNNTEHMLSKWLSDFVITTTIFLSSLCMLDNLSPHPVACYVLLFLLSLHLLFCFVPGYFYTLHRGSSAFYIHCMSCHVLAIVWVDGPFCSICIWRLGILMRVSSAIVFFISSCLPCSSLYHQILFFSYVSDIAVSSLWVSSPLAHSSACSLLTSTASFILVSYFIISAIFTWSFMLLMNCSFSPVLFPLYLHYVAVMLNLSIYSWAVSLLCPPRGYNTGVIILSHCVVPWICLLILQIVWLLFGMILIKFVLICMNRNPSLPNQLFFDCYFLFMANFNMLG